MKKRILCVLLCALMILQTLPLAVGADGVTCSPVCVGTNRNANEYVWNFSAPINSYLSVTDDGMLMRVQWGALENALLVDYFDRTYEYRYSLTVKAELPIFGGFHVGTDGYYYLVTGQTNYDELADTECFRVTKYDRDWNRIDAVGLYDCNTTVPFNAGSLRFAEHGQYLLIRTAHEMYTSPDGLNHQANVTLSLDTRSMTFAGTACEVAPSLAGYVSHSFNQFLLMDGNTLVAIDHGDAYPRSIVLARAVLPLDGTLDIFTEEGFYRGHLDKFDLFAFPGATGENYTGACIGGFEYSDSAYLVAFNTVAQDGNYYQNQTKNICIATLNKQTEEIRILPVTDYAEGDGTTGVPHLVKLSNNSFLLMWMRRENLYYAVLNGDGEVVGEVQCAPDGTLSDCAPIVIDGKVVWYVYQGNRVTFYELDGETLEFRLQTTDTSHDWQVLEYPTEAGGECRGICKRCGTEGSFATPEYLLLNWGYDPSELYYKDYWFAWEGPFEVGTLLYWRLTPITDVMLTVSDTQGIVLDQGDGTLLCAKEGTYTLTLTHAYNPHLTRSFKIKVGHRYRYGCDTVCENCGHVREAGHVPGPLYIWPYPTCTEDGHGVTYCTFCNVELSHETIPATGHSYTEWWISMHPTCTEGGWEGRMCMNCGTYETQELPVTEHRYNAFVTLPTCTEGGFTTYICNCGDSYVAHETPATGHYFGRDCDTVCENCDYVREAEHIHSPLYIRQYPTCIEGGYGVTYCTMCGVELSCEMIPAMGHSFGQWYDGALGKEERFCNTCGEAETRDKEPDFDIDGNGRAEQADLTLLMSVLVGNTETDILFDLDFDGRLTVYDCVLLMQQLQ